MKVLPKVYPKQESTHASCLVCIYHHDDPDGYVSEYYIKESIDSFKDTFNKAFGTSYDTIDIVSMPRDYNSDFNYLQMPSRTEEYDDVILFFVDLSFTNNNKDKLEEAISLNRKTKRVVWIDHHESSLEYAKKLKYEDWFNLDPYCLTLVNTEACGAALCSFFYGMLLNLSKVEEDIASPIKKFPIPTNLWNKYLIQNTKIFIDNENKKIIFNDASSILSKTFTPSSIDVQNTLWYTDEFIYHLDSYDRWTLENPDANAFLYGLKCFDIKHLEEFYDPYSTYELSQDIITKGYTVLTYLENQYDFESKDIHFDYILGFKIAFKNGMGNSLNFNNLLSDNKIDAAILYHLDGRTKRWAYSIYGNKALTLKVNKIAEAFGGGGHPGAAGFSLDDCCLALYDQDEPITLEKFLYEKFPNVYNEFFSQMMATSVYTASESNAVYLNMSDLSESGKKKLFGVLSEVSEDVIIPDDDEFINKAPIAISYIRSLRHRDNDEDS